MHSQKQVLGIIIGSTEIQTRARTLPLCYATPRLFLRRYNWIDQITWNARGGFIITQSEHQRVKDRSSLLAESTRGIFNRGGPQIWLRWIESKPTMQVEKMLVAPLILGKWQHADVTKMFGGKMMFGNILRTSSL